MAVIGEPQWDDDLSEQLRAADKKFCDALASRSEEINKLLELDPLALSFGPSYELETSSGLKLKVFVFRYESEDIGRKHKYRGDKFQLFALDLSGNILALKDFGVCNNGGEMCVYSEIVTAVRGAGLSTALELCFLDLIQRYTDLLGRNVCWRVENSNAYDLFVMDLRKSLGEKIDEVLYSNLEMEQDRWQSLYGDRGKLGLKKRSKLFSPRSEVLASRHDFDVLDTVVLSRFKYRRKANRIHPRVDLELFVDENDKSLLKEKRRSEALVILLQAALFLNR